MYTQPRSCFLLSHLENCSVIYSEGFEEAHKNDRVRQNDLVPDPEPRYWSSSANYQLYPVLFALAFISQLSISPKARDPLSHKLKLRLTVYLLFVGLECLPAGCWHQATFWSCATHDRLPHFGRVAV
jgi:hypothetical protein